MFRASPWISYEPQSQPPTHPIDDSTRIASPPSPHDPSMQPGDMDTPEISILREEEEETPPPDPAGLPFSKFRVNLRMPARGHAPPGSGVGPSVGVPSANRMVASPLDSDDDEEEDQLIDDDDELAIVTETGRALDPSSPLTAAGNPPSTPSPHRRGGTTQGRQRGSTGRRGRPGREPPDAAAMMSTFELAKTDPADSSPPPVVPPPPVMVAPPQPAPGPSNPARDWSSAPPPKPPRRKPGPKKGSTLGPRGPRKPKTGHNTPGTSTPVPEDHLLLPEPSSFLIPSIPPTPGSDQLPLPLSHLPQIMPPDFVVNPSTPVPLYPLPSRAFPVQAPPKPPAGYATTHPVDAKRGPVRKWQIVQREIKGIAGGRWFARSWLSPVPPDPDPASSARTEPFPNGLHAFSDSEHVAPGAPGALDGVASRGPGSSRTRTSVSPTSPGSADVPAGPP